MKGSRSLLVLPLLMIANLADATNISVSGKVILVPCTVDADTVNKEVELPKAQAHNLASAGTGADWADFDLVLSNCPSSITTATALFSGTADVDDATTYKNIGTGQNVSLQMVARNDVYGNGSSMKKNIDNTTHEATFPLSARIYSPKGGAIAGTFNSVVNVTFSYQ